jgi:hypothetical protein
MGYSPPRPPPRYDVTTTGERDRLLEEICYGSTSMVSDRGSLSVRRVPATPCVYCGRKAPADVYQCLGCGAPR